MFSVIFSVKIHALTMLRPCAKSDFSSLHSVPIDLESENKAEAEAHIGVFAMPYNYCDYTHNYES